jgi:hypothetical protein
MQVHGPCAQSQPGQPPGICGLSSFRDDRLPAGLCVVGSGGGTTGGIGFIKGSLSTRTTNDRRSIAKTKIAKDALLFFGEQTACIRALSRTSRTSAPAFARDICQPSGYSLRCRSIISYGPQLPSDLARARLRRCGVRKLKPARFDLTVGRRAAPQTAVLTAWLNPNRGYINRHRAFFVLPHNATVFSPSG